MPEDLKHLFWRAEPSRPQRVGLLVPGPPRAQIRQRDMLDFTVASAGFDDTEFAFDAVKHSAMGMGSRPAPKNADPNNFAAFEFLFDFISCSHVFSNTNITEDHCTTLVFTCKVISNIFVKPLKPDYAKRACPR